MKPCNAYSEGFVWLLALDGIMYVCITAQPCSFLSVPAAVGTVRNEQDCADLVFRPWST